MKFNRVPGRSEIGYGMASSYDDFRIQSDTE